MSKTVLLKRDNNSDVKYQCHKAVERAYNYLKFSDNLQGLKKIWN